MEEHILGFNQISEELRKKVKKLGRDETAIYQVRGLRTNRAVNTTPEGFDEVSDMPMYPNSFLPATCVISDVDGREIPIGYISGYAPAPVGAMNATPTPVFGDRGQYGFILFAASSNGMITVTSRDQAKYEYLELTDYNENSVNPNKRKPDSGYLFRRIHLAKEASKEVLEEVEMGKMLATASRLTLEELQFSAPFLGINSTLSHDEILVQFFKEIRKDYKRVRDVLEDEVTNLTKLIQTAQLKRWLVLDEQAGEWTKGDTTETLVFVTQGADPIAAMMEFLQKNAKGIDLRRTLEKRLQKGSDASTGRRASKKATTKAVAASHSRDADPDEIDQDDDLVDTDDDDEQEEDTSGPFQDDAKGDVTQL